MNMIGAKTQLYCLIGDPVGHSLSPLMQNAAFAACGINAVYLAVAVKKEMLKDALSSMKSLNIRGMNVTMPHKTEAIKYLDRLEGAAQEIGAVNTIVNEDGTLVGHNTDVDGALLAIKDRVSGLRGKKAVVLGAGGAAMAVAFGLSREGCMITVLARDRAKAKKRMAFSSAPEGSIDVKHFDEETLRIALQGAGLLCNCTPVGMDGESPVCKDLLRKELAVFDSVYVPGASRLVSDAKAAGCIAIGGEELLANQGAESFRLWTGKEPDRQIMLGVLREKLRIANPGRENIFLTGFMGSGKTSVGRVIAEKLGMPFIDTDDEIEKAAGKKISHIFSESGEDYFRELEINAIELCCKKRNCIIAVGGGAVMNNLNVMRMKSCGKIVLLKATTKTIAERVGDGSERPLLLKAGEAKVATRIGELLREREPFYAHAKDIEIDTDNKSIDSIAGMIIEAVGVGK